MALHSDKPNQAPQLPKPVTAALQAPLDLAHVFSTPPAAMDFVLPGLLAGGIGMLAAPGGSGKTYLLLDIAASVAAGNQATGIWPAPASTGRVVLMAAEDPHTVLHHRLHAFGQGLDDEAKAALAQQLHIYSLSGEVPTIMATDPKAGPRESWEWLNPIMEAARGARLLVLDPIRRFHGGDENDSNHMTRLVQILEWVAKETGCAILFSHHTGKNASLSGQGDVQQAARGSSALTDAVRWQANLVGMTKEECSILAVPTDSRKSWVRLAFTKSNYGAPTEDVWLMRGPGGVLFKGDPGKSKTDGIQESKKKKGRSRD
jgi:RecA-family ATPase